MLELVYQPVTPEANLMRITVHPFCQNTDAVPGNHPAALRRPSSWPYSKCSFLFFDAHASYSPAMLAKRQVNVYYRIPGFKLLKERQGSI